MSELRRPVADAVERALDEMSTWCGPYGYIRGWRSSSITGTNTFEAPSRRASGEAVPCQECGGITRVWCADDALWNEVVGSPNGMLCPNCFIDRAEAAGKAPRVWRLTRADAAS